MSEEIFPVGARISFNQTDLVRTFEIGDEGTVTEAFAPNTGRNVQLSDGHIVNVPVWYLDYTAAEKYSRTHYVAPGDYGDLAIWEDQSGTDFRDGFSQIVQLYRKDLPSGPSGDEMWTRLITGLPAYVA